MIDTKDKDKINSNSKDILNEIKNKLNQIIEYIQNNLMNITYKNLDSDEKEMQNKRKVKLGVKRKKKFKKIG